MPSRKSKYRNPLDTLTWDINIISRGYPLTDGKRGYFDLDSLKWISPDLWEVMYEHLKRKVLADHEIYEKSRELWGPCVGHEAGMKKVREYYAKPPK